MDYYIEKFKLSNNYDKKELKKLFKSKINELKNSNLSSGDKELYLQYLSEIYDNLKNYIFEKNILNKNFDTLDFTEIKNDDFNNNNNLLFKKNYKIITNYDNNMPIINTEKQCNDKVHREVINMARINNNPLFNKLIKL
jgi:hypothetical protein